MPVNKSLEKPGFSGDSFLLSLKAAKRGALQNVLFCSAPL